MKSKENKRRLSQQARREFKALRKELKKANPDPDLINYLMNGEKYSYPIFNNSTNPEQDPQRPVS